MINAIISIQLLLLLLRPNVPKIYLNGIYFLIPKNSFLLKIAVIIASAPVVEVIMIIQLWVLPFVQILYCVHGRT